jgi:gamma-tubulin complex component 5
MLEALGDDNALPALAELFYACFKTYMRSIQAWMEGGHIDPADRTFFIRENSANDDLRSLWDDWYSLNEGPRGQNIPRFLEISIQKVFTTGKTMVFLRHLNALQDVSLDKYAVTLENVLPSHSSSLALPFSALVQSALEKLVDANHSVSAGFLRKELDEQCGLWASLDAIQHVYLGKDLSVLSMIDAKVFELIDRGRSWNDKLLLTEVTRTAFSAVGVIDPSRLVVRPTGDRTVKILETISIDYILPWPVANIIAEDAIHSYQRISVFLMQIRRAKYAIVKQRLRNARNVTESDENDTLAHALHHNLLWFLDFLYGHITYLVISSADQSLHSALSSAEDVDAMIAAHKVYMSSLEDQCLVSENLSPIHDAIINLLDLCVRFADLQTVHSWDAQDRMVEESHIGISKAYRRTRVPEDEDVDSDSDEDYDHEQTLMVSFRDSPYDYQLRTVQGQFEHLVAFIADGLKGVARADGQPSWDILADRLGWRKGLVKF